MTENLIKLKNIGRKFNEDGSARFFPGNTIISKVKKDNLIYPVIERIADAFRKGKGAAKYVFLPPESYHMTMIQGVCEEDRRKELWSCFLPLDAPLERVDDFFEKEFKKVGKLPRTEMVFDYIDLSNGTILVRFLPASKADAQNLKKFRDEVSGRLGVRFPDHERYGFHISVAYQLWEMDEAEEESMREICRTLEEKLKKDRPAFCLRQPELTYFENMFCFNASRIERVQR